MAIEVAITGGEYDGVTADISDYGVTEESTPLEISDSSGGTGAISFKAVDEGSRFGALSLVGSTITLIDSENGRISGKVTELSGEDGNISVNADSRLTRLVVEVAAAPVYTDFEDAILYYLSLGGIVDDIQIDDSLKSIPVIAPGWQGDLWTKIKELCAFVKAEPTQIRNTIMIRPARLRRVLAFKSTSIRWDVKPRDIAQAVEVYNYNTERRVNALAYPPDGWNSDVSPQTINVGERASVPLDTKMYLESIQQPLVFDTLPTDYQGGSAYCVTGKDGEPITAAEWRAAGGSVDVQIGDDGTSIILNITGPNANIRDLAPFRLGVKQPDESIFSTLRIYGTGIYMDPVVNVLGTSATTEMTSRDVGVSVDNIFIRTAGDARSAGAETAARWSLPEQTVSVRGATILGVEDDGQLYGGATFNDLGDFVDERGWVTFNDLNADPIWGNMSYDEFSEFWEQQSRDSFEFQVFGNIQGARFPYRHVMYRVRSATPGATGVDFTAEADTTFNDFKKSADITDMTYDEFSELFGEKTFGEFALAPLPNEFPEYDIS